MTFTLKALRLVRLIVGFPLIWLGTTVMDQRDSNVLHRRVAAMIEERDASRPLG